MYLYVSVYVPNKIREACSLKMEFQAIVSFVMWVLGTELGSLARTAGALNPWAISPAPDFLLLVVIFVRSLIYVVLFSKTKFLCITLSVLELDL